MAKNVCAEYFAAKKSLEAECEKASQERKAEIKKRILALPQIYAPRFLEFAKSNISDENSFDPLLWTAIEVGQGKLFDEALVLLREHFADKGGNPTLWVMLADLVGSESDEVNPFLRRILERNPDKYARGAACYYLAVRLKRRAERIGSNELGDESARLLRRAIDEFGEVRCRSGSVGDEAKRELNNLHGPLGIGHVAPDTAGEDLDGVKFKLTDYRGKVVLLSFCGQWCGPCRKMYPHEQALVEKLSAKAFSFIEVNSDGDRISHREFMKKKNFTWRYFCDGQQGPISAAWEIRESPTFYVLDREGVIRYKAIGEVDDATLTNWTNTLLNEATK